MPVPGRPYTQSSPLRIALVAGELSGDQLGAALINAIRARCPEAQFEGIAGPRMRAAGCRALAHAEKLAVMGLAEVLVHLPGLLRLRRRIGAHFLASPPDVFVGIDAPDFNLSLEARLRRRGITTLHWVSPSVWAWRRYRLATIRNSVDLVMTLFPFEARFYAEQGVTAAYVGHPLADQLSPDDDPRGARNRLGLDPLAETVALLPGSRAGEIGRLAGPMLGAAALLAQRRPGIRFVCAAADENAQALFEQERERIGGIDVRVVRGDTRAVIAAADCVLCASGTATLETMLVNRPLVMTYRVAPSTYRVGRLLKLVRLEWFSLPNILAGRGLVPELIQDEATPENLAVAAGRWLDDGAARDALRRDFLALHERLRCDAARRAAEAVAGLLERNAE